MLTSGCFYPPHQVETLTRYRCLSASWRPNMAEGLGLHTAWCAASGPSEISWRRSCPTRSRSWPTCWRARQRLCIEAKNVLQPWDLIPKVGVPKTDLLQLLADGTLARLHQAGDAANNLLTCTCGSIPIATYRRMLETTLVDQDTLLLT